MAPEPVYFLTFILQPLFLRHYIIFFEAIICEFINYLCINKKCTLITNVIQISSKKVNYVPIGTFFKH